MNQEDIEKIIIKSIERLKERDMSIIRIEHSSTVIEYLPAEEKYERKLHEVCINHRFAVYIEQFVNEIDDSYYVDIEYNRYYKNQKYIKAHSFSGVVRPDIIIHKRTEKSEVQHLLVIEAKKDSISQHDEDKIKGLMEDPYYKYKYGCRIIYKELEDAKIFFYYHEKGKIKNKQL